MTILTFEGEPNERGMRREEPREAAKAQFQQSRAEFDNGQTEARFYPYNSRQQFRMARRNVFPVIPTRNSIAANCVGRISDRLHPTELQRRFKSVEQFFSHLDEISCRVTPWKTADQKIPSPYTLMHRDCLEVLQELVGDRTVGKRMIWAPVVRRDHDGNRVYSECNTGDWW